jgi:streptomycin 6-kinase
MSEPVAPGPTGEDVRPGFRAFVARIGGDDGRAWIASVPGRLRAVAASFDVELGDELPGGLLACTVEATTRDGGEAVLKLASPWGRGADEAAALRTWAGGGAPELLAHDPERGAILLERIRPGVHADGAAAEDVARLLRSLRVPPGREQLPALSDVAGKRIATAEAEGRATPRRVAWAREALARLAADAPPAVVVHGDFDERNILVCARRGLCAIDPLACVGDPLYDAASWIHGNRLPGRRGRFDALAHALDLADLERRRLRDWCGVVAVHG